MRGSTDTDHHLPRTWLTACLICCLVISVNASDTVDLPALIRGLGADLHQERERASAALRAAGDSALEVLREATTSDDPEVRHRASVLLSELELGITSAWPEHLTQMARSFASLDPNERTKAMHAINKTMKDQAVPFLLTRLRDADPDTASQAWQLLRKQDTVAVAELVVRRLSKPVNPTEQLARAWALLRLKKPVEALEALPGNSGQEPLHHEIVEQVVKSLLKLRAGNDYEQLRDQARRLARAAGSDSRLLYLEAEGWEGLGNDSEASAVRQRALALQPGNKAAHFTAACMLQDLDLWTLAMRELEAVLDIPPAGDVYEMNARLRLGSIHQTAAKWSDAADQLQAALDMYRQARAKGEHSGFGIVGGTEQELEDMIRTLRKKAEEGEQPRPQHEECTLDVSTEVKGSRMEDLENALAGVAAHVTMNIQPREFRLFDQETAGLQWNAEADQIVPMLNGAPCSEPLPFKLAGERATIALHALDCIYLYEVQRDRAAVTKIARYEMDYTVKLLHGPVVGSLRHVTATLNQEPVAWSKLVSGFHMDFLPNQFILKISGETPDGQTLNAQIEWTGDPRPKSTPQPAATPKP